MQGLYKHFFGTTTVIGGLNCNLTSVLSAKRITKRGTRNGGFGAGTTCRHQPTVAVNKLALTMVYIVFVKKGSDLEKKKKWHKWLLRKI